MASAPSHQNMNRQPDDDNGNDNGRLTVPPQAPLHMQSSAQPAEAHQPGPIRPALPDRNVTAEGFEDAFVSFILYCNPALPAGTETETLREAFRALPKSGGKSFSAINLFLLVRQFEAKQLRTWAELALKLGVDPPDTDKGESSQKIQQYAVRLKRWMHSMHVDAFFEYLMDIPNPYYNQIPSDPDPICEEGRDGVAPVDDMALRALVPQARPKRGRKRLEDDFGSSPSQRPRLGSPPDRQGPWSAHPDGAAPETSAPGFRGPDPRTLMASPYPRSNEPLQTPLTAYPQGPFSAVTPATRGGFWSDVPEPKSAITPSGKASQRRHGAKVVSSAWRSHGLASSRGGKTRGRPPLNRNSDNGTFSQYVPMAPPQGQDSSPLAAADGPQPASVASAMPSPSRAGASTAGTDAPTIQPPSTPGLHAIPGDTSRPARPNISLQVPERPGGSVRLATPPPPQPPVQAAQHQSAAAAPAAPAAPPPMAAGGRSWNPYQQQAVPEAVFSNTAPCVDIPHSTVSHSYTGNSVPDHDLHSAPAARPAAPGTDPVPNHGSKPNNEPASSTAFPSAPANASSGPIGGDNPTSDKPDANPDHSSASASAPSSTPNIPPGFFDNMDDRTNLDAIYAFFIHETIRGDWTDAQGNPIPPCGVGEAHAIISSTLEGLYKAAPSHEGFLINLAALAGGRSLMTTSKLKMQRLAQYDDSNLYSCAWEYRLGPFKGQYKMTQTVRHDRWQGKGSEREKAKGLGKSVGGDAGANANANAGGGERAAAQARRGSRGGVDGGNQNQHGGLDGNGEGEGDDQAAAPTDGADGDGVGRAAPEHGAAAGSAPAETSNPLAEEWKRKYEDLLGTAQERDRQLSDLKFRVFETLAKS